MTENLPLNQTPPTTEGIPDYSGVRTGFHTIKILIGGEEYSQIKPNKERKIYRIPATDQDPEKEITTWSTPDGATVTKTTYFWGQHLNADF